MIPFHKFLLASILAIFLPIIGYSETDNPIEGPINGPRYAVDPYWPKPLHNNWIWDKYRNNPNYRLS